MATPSGSALPAGPTCPCICIQPMDNVISRGTPSRGMAGFKGSYRRRAAISGTRPHPTPTEGPFKQGRIIRWINPRVHHEWGFRGKELNSEIYYIWGPFQGNRRGGLFGELTWKRLEHWIQGDIFRFSKPSTRVYTNQMGRISYKMPPFSYSLSHWVQAPFGPDKHNNKLNIIL